MKIKNILRTCLVCCGFTAVLTSCNNGDAFFTADADDAPRILNTDFPAAGFSINRNENLKFDVLVTPADYTTIKWLADGKVVYVGRTIDQPFEAGDYTLKILATTVKGKETSRTMKLTVKPLDSDPQIKNAKKNRWLNPGVALTIVGSNLDGVKSLVFSPVVEETATRADEPAVECGDIEVSCQAAEDGNSVTATLPAGMTNGSYRVSAVKDNGERFGCGIVTVTDEEWVDPDVEKKLLWEGSQVINWGDANVRLTAEQLADVPEGTTIYIKYSLPEAEYHAMRITTDWWDYEIVSQFDITGDTPNPFGFEYTAEVMEKVQTEGAMLIVGFGYEVQEVYYEALNPNAETVLWEEDPVVINWGDSNIHLTAEQLASVQPGATIRVYYEMVDADYHALRVTSNWWEYDFVSQFDITAETPNPFEFEFTSEHQQKAQEQEGMLVVGFGYRVSKITFK